MILCATRHCAARATAALQSLATGPVPVLAELLAGTTGATGRPVARTKAVAWSRWTR
ncbi:hypothetical protein [Umezawaea beigongshangensis]|uniref:hypothetical protein n=1 Tax=Umezawaea beigongshangensis TaxID=2780383 RepID=UPI0018F1A707|nr:hypothetical protein [Umezawaea beigongshangensis]